MTKVSVVIPYYQREAGILRRAVGSIYAQELPASVEVDILVVDDESPAPPEPELAGFTRDGMSIQILKRPNGGPAKARNAGLDAAVGSDIVAFLDSDDTWMKRHLATGLGAIARGAGFYFADTHDDETNTWFGSIRCFDTLLADTAKDGDGVQWISGERIMPFLLSECLAHTSTVIFDYLRHRAIRFDQHLIHAGEDYLFWVSLASQATSIAFTSIPMVSRGRGVNLYRSAFDWNRPECIRRLFYVVLMHKKMLAHCATRAQTQLVTNKLGRARRGIIFLVVRNAILHRQVNGWIFRRLAREDAQFWLHLPRNAFVMVATKLRGKLELPAEL